jgi:hypothetical protein
MSLSGTGESAQPRIFVLHENIPWVGRRGMQAIALHLKRLLLEKCGSATGLASAA